jgi:hypothetical protein
MGSKHPFMRAVLVLLRDSHDPFAPHSQNQRRAARYPMVLREHGTVTADRVADRVGLIQQLNQALDTEEENANQMASLPADMPEVSVFLRVKPGLPIRQASTMSTMTIREELCTWKCTARSKVWGLMIEALFWTAAMGDSSRSL